MIAELFLQIFELETLTRCIMQHLEDKTGLRIARAHAFASTIEKPRMEKV